MWIRFWGLLWNLPAAPANDHQITVLLPGHTCSPAKAPSEDNDLRFCLWERLKWVFERAPGRHQIYVSAYENVFGSLWSP